MWDHEHRSERRHPGADPDQRTPFERDRDRVLYCSAFNRLAGITQIVRADESDVFHTRQQHTLKVAQVGRRLAEKLLREQSGPAEHRGLHPEVVEAACLAHDLGHPPFGHVGEHVLDQLVMETDDQGFEGNAQSFRILTKLAVRFPDEKGINLSRATLAACLKYPWYRDRTGSESKKWSAYSSEREDFEFARDGRPDKKKTLEAELMDWADDVAYSVHDIEDFHRCNALPWSRVFNERETLISKAAKSNDDKTLLENAYERLHGFLDGTYSQLLQSPYEGWREQREQLRRMTSQLISRYIGAISVNPELDDKTAVVFDDDRRNEVRILKQITRDYIIDNSTLAAQQYGYKKVITDLFRAFEDGYDTSVGYPPFVPIRLRYLFTQSHGTKARKIADCIAGLTETEAIKLHGRLYGSLSGSVLDPIVR